LDCNRISSFKPWRVRPGRIDQNRLTAVLTLRASRLRRSSSVAAQLVEPATPAFFRAVLYPAAIVMASRAMSNPDRNRILIDSAAGQPWGKKEGRHPGGESGIGCRPWAALTVSYPVIRKSCAIPVMNRCIGRAFCSRALLATRRPHALSYTEPSALIGPLERIRMVAC
jgi:hypothetical protein